MRILLNDYAGYPFILDFAHKLANREYHVRYTYAGYNTTPKGATDVTPHPYLCIEPLYIKEPIRKDKFTKRWFQEREYGYLVAKVVEDFRPDIVISANTPLDAQSILLRCVHRNRGMFVFWLQDLIGIATRNILGRRLSYIGQLIGQYYIHLEKTLLNRSNHVVTITSDFQPLLSEWGIPMQHISIIPNWAPLDTLPVRPKNNRWAIKQNLHDKFCFMYTGTLGMKHDPAILLQLALHYRDDHKVRVVVISDGLGVEWLQEQKERFALENLILLEYQPFSVMPEVMGAADVLIALLEPEAGIFSVPSKVLSYLCAQRPILAAIPQENLAARIISRTDAGIVVAPKDTPAFLQAAETLKNNNEYRKRMGENGRAYAEEHFNIDEIISQFEHIFKIL